MGRTGRNWRTHTKQSKVRATPWFSYGQQNPDHRPIATPWCSLRQDGATVICPQHRKRFPDWDNGKKHVLAIRKEMRLSA